MLVCENLSLNFPGAKKWNNSSFVLNSGQCLVIEGANGVGKSTWLRLVAGMLPAKGNILWNDISFVQDSWRDNIVYVGADVGINEFCSVRDILHDKIRCYFTYDFIDTFSRIVDFLQLKEALDLPFHSLSAGQKRRVDFFLLPVTKRQIWLLDEPFIFLDKSWKKSLIEMINRHLKSGGVVCMCTHDVENIELTTRHLLERKKF